VLSAMDSVPRHLFMPREVREYAYDDIPLPIGSGQTISAPGIVAMMCDILDIRDGMTILEVGTGLGYHAAVLSVLVGSGTVYTVEYVPELAGQARSILRALGYDNVEVVVSDGGEGLSAHAPYDRISVACAAPRIPSPLVEQLKDGGKMVLPVGKFMQELVLVEKSGGNVTSKNMGGVAFVPLRGRQGI
jgi:protein-L-isoaspartate(D-aspartate) O-methyltransferase